MTRIIRIKTCAECPNRDHAGAFGRVACVPECGLIKPVRELPHGVVLTGKRLMAAPTFQIPDWCPLEKADKTPEGGEPPAPRKPTTDAALAASLLHHTWGIPDIPAALAIYNQWEQLSEGEVMEFVESAYWGIHEPFENMSLEELWTSINCLARSIDECREVLA